MCTHLASASQARGWSGHDVDLRRGVLFPQPRTDDGVAPVDVDVVLVVLLVPLEAGTQVPGGLVGGEGGADALQAGRNDEGDVEEEAHVVLGYVEEGLAGVGLLERETSVVQIVLLLIFILKNVLC